MTNFYHFISLFQDFFGVVAKFFVFKFFKIMVKTSPFMEYANHVGRQKGIYDMNAKIEEANKTWPTMSEEQRAP
jgi:hypothetical protein